MSNFISVAPSSAELSREEKLRTQSITQSLTHSVTRSPSLFMPGSQNFRFGTCIHLLIPYWVNRLELSLPANIAIYYYRPILSAKAGTHFTVSRGAEDWVDCTAVRVCMQIRVAVLLWKIHNNCPKIHNCPRRNANLRSHAPQSGSLPIDMQCNMPIDADRSSRQTQTFSTEIQNSQVFLMTSVEPEASESYVESNWCSHSDLLALNEPH